MCSKNDEADAWEPFDKHPEMILRRDDIACFVANWDDKAHNIRLIAERLNIGLDAIVFLDDNPFERGRVRAALPMVAVPEIPDDPALVPDALAAAGYFEAVAVTAEDRDARAAISSATPRATPPRPSAPTSPTICKAWRCARSGAASTRSASRAIVQLVNKTHQFNLTTRRMSEAEYDALLGDEQRRSGCICVCVDRFGDNGLIAVVIAAASRRAISSSTPG